MGQEIHVRIPKTERSFADEFLRIYEPFVFQNSSATNRREIKKIKYRTCRFCGKNSNQVSFKKEAHIISELLGSRRFLSSEECDNCNELFGMFESNLASYLGIFRTVNSFDINSKAPSFQSGNGNIKAKRVNGLIYFTKKVGSEDIDYNSENNKLKLLINTQSYIPAYVYNAFLKIAMHIMPKQELSDYGYILRYLLDRNGYSLFKEIKHLFLVESEMIYKHPFAILYKRKPEIRSTEYPLHVFCLYCNNFMYQICFPLHKENISRANNSLSFIYAPYVVLGSLDTEFDNIETKRYQDDLSSIQLTNGNNSVVFNLNKDEMDNLVAFDPRTNSYTPAVIKRT
jgi:hypothetical protein